MRYIFAWLALTTVAALGLSTIYLIDYWGIYNHGSASTATVVKLTPEQHFTVIYEYKVDGKIFNGQLEPSAPNPPLNALKVGDKLTVYFNQSKPKSSIIGRPSLLLRGEAISVVLSAMVISFAILFGTQKGFRAKLEVYIQRKVFNQT